MLTCGAVLALAVVILFIGTLLLFGLISLAAAGIAIALVAVPLFLILAWRYIYPWLVRMGRWAAQLRNIIFLAVVMVAVGIGLGYILDIPTVSLFGLEINLLTLLFGLIFFFLLFLAIVVWLVRLWRRGWPTTRNVFWDMYFRIGALFWRILVGIPLGIIWFFYHPPLRWLIAALLFYLRWTSAAAAWLLYNPPLRDIKTAGLFVTRLIARLVALILHNPLVRAFVLASASVAVILITEELGIPINPIVVIVLFALLWPIPAMLFILRLIARFISTIIYGIWSWWPVTGVRGTLRKGLTADSKSYQDYDYA